MSRAGTFMERRPIRNSTILPNEVFQLGLRPTAIAVYAYLRRLANEEYQCWPSYASIAEAVGCSERTVPKYVYELCEKRLVSVEQTSVVTKDGLKWNGNLRYTILPIKGAVEYHDEQQLARLDAALERKRVRMKRAEQHRDQRRKSQAKYLESVCAARDPEKLPF